MKKKEAYQELGLPETASKEEVKKAFKAKAKVLHPDINKEPDAEVKFKRANEAFQAIENNTFDDNPVSFGNPFAGGFNITDLGDLFDFSGFGFGQKTRSRSYRMEAPKDIRLDQTISFKEAVLGCKRDLTYACDIMCEKCHGQGDKLVDNGCKTCGGKGKIFGQQGMMFFERPCTECKGKVKHEACSACSSSGKITSERTISVSIKPGIGDGAILRLVGVGNYSTTHQPSNVLVSIKVIPVEGLTINGNDVVAYTNISLLEAIKGCQKEVDTINGKQKINISPLSKNKDEVLIYKLGVAGQGNERVIVNVEYPKQIEKLVEMLEGDK